MHSTGSVHQRPHNMQSVGGADCPSDFRTDAN